MANPQTEHGFIRIATEIWEALARTRIPGEARQVLDFIIRKTYGYQKKKDQIATSQIMGATGLRRRAVEKARKLLKDWNMIATAKKGGSQVLVYSFNKDYEKWRLPPKKAYTTAKKGGEVPPKKRHTIDNIDNTIDKRPGKTPALCRKTVDNPEVKAAMDQIEKGGFNIYAMVYKAKEGIKQTKDWRFPDQVILRVCEAYHNEKAKIREPWPWFIEVLKQESIRWNAEQHEKESKTRDKRAPFAHSIKEILKTT